MKETVDALELLSKDRIEELFILLTEQIKNQKSPFTKSLSTLSARFYSWKRDQTFGIKNDNIEINKIRTHLYDFIQDWEKELITSKPQNVKIQMDYTKVRKKHLEQHVKNLSILLSKWETKRDLADNPTEEVKSEMHIMEMKNSLDRYQQELKELKNTEIEGPIRENVPTNHELFTYDAFVSFADQDKQAFALPLVEALELRGKKIWCSAKELVVGDSIAEEVNKAITFSQFGIIILSPYYFKSWPINELNAFFAKYTSGNKNLILPIWHKIDYKEVRHQTPLIADKLAINSNVGVDIVADHLIKAMNKQQVT